MNDEQKKEMQVFLSNIILESSEGLSQVTVRGIPNIEIKSVSEDSATIVFHLVSQLKKDLTLFALGPIEIPIGRSLRFDDIKSKTIIMLDNSKSDGRH